MPMNNKIHYLLFIMLVIPSIARADWCEDYSPANWSIAGERYGFKISIKDIDDEVEWDGKSEPPLSVYSAIKLAKESAKKLPELQGRVNFDQIRLQKYACRTKRSVYFYVVAFELLYKNKLPNGYHYVIVMPSGKVFLPIKRSSISANASKTLKIIIHPKGYIVNKIFVGKQDELQNTLSKLNKKEYKKVELQVDSRSPNIYETHAFQIIERVGLPEPEVTLVPVK